MRLTPNRASPAFPYAPLRRELTGHECLSCRPYLPELQLGSSVMTSAMNLDLPLGFEPRSADYESAALPLSYERKLELLGGFDPLPIAYRAIALPNELKQR